MNDHCCGYYGCCYCCYYCWSGCRSGATVDAEQLVVVGAGEESVRKSAVGTAMAETGTGTVGHNGAAAGVVSHC